MGVAAVAALLFCGLMLAVLEGDAASFDGAVRMGVHGYASPWLTACVEILTRFGSVAFLAVFTLIEIVVLWRSGRRSDGRFVFIVMAGALLLENAVKFSIRRPRPEAFFGVDPETYSFPSGHALLSACFYGSLAIIGVRRGGRRAIFAGMAVCAAAAIGVTRIYLGVHYPSDVVAGYLLAIAWLCAVLALRGDAPRGPDRKSI